MRSIFRFKFYLFWRGFPNHHRLRGWAEPCSNHSAHCHLELWHPSQHVWLVREAVEFRSLSGIVLRPIQSLLWSVSDWSSTSGLGQFHQFQSTDNILTQLSRQNSKQAKKGPKENEQDVMKEKVNQTAYGNLASKISKNYAQEKDFLMVLRIEAIY